MPRPSHTLSFATDSDGQLFIHADAGGLDHLMRSLTQMRRKLEENVCEHDHLMTDAWGGYDLTERSLAESPETIHHVTIYGWTQEWIEKHGLSK